MPVPQVYGDVNLVIKVDPMAMYHEAAVVMPGHGTVIAESINRIAGIWNGLQGNWVGRSADEAQAFNEAWNRAVGKLFGTHGDPQAGILNQIGKAVALASINYAQTETIVTKMFRDIASRVTPREEGIAGNSPSGPGPDPHTRDITTGPVTEHTP